MYGYELYRDDVLIYTGDNLSFVDQSLGDGAHHEYKVRSFQDLEGSQTRQYGLFVGPIEGCTVPSPAPVTLVRFARA
jgi:hypothetical protein